VRQSFARIGVWAQRPGAILTSGGDVTLADGASVILAHPDVPSTGGPERAVITSGQVRQAGGVVVGPPGTPSESLTSEGVDGAPRTVDEALRHLVQLPAVWWGRLPTVTRVSCPPGGCTGNDLTDALHRDTPGVFIDGDLDLTAAPGASGAPESWSVGTASSPVLWVVRGRASVRASLQFHGVLLARSIDWRSAGTSSLSGAAVATEGIQLSGAVTAMADASVLDTLAQRTPAWIPVAGSWEDAPDD
jgi:hypothetical protein